MRWVFWLANISQGWIAAELGHCEIDETADPRRRVQALPMHDVYRQWRRFIISEDDLQLAFGNQRTDLIGQQTGDAEPGDRCLPG